jgi:hypothetical protein
MGDKKMGNERDERTSRIIRLYFFVTHFLSTVFALIGLAGRLRVLHAQFA